MLRKPISPTWFAAKRNELAEIAKALSALKSRHETIKPQDTSNLSEYKTVEQRKKEIAEEQQRKQAVLVDKISLKQEHAKRTRSERPQTRSQFWLQHNAKKVAEIKSAREQQNRETEFHIDF